MKYNWQHKNWPSFTYTLTGEAEKNLLLFAEETGYVAGLLTSLPGDVKIETLVNTLVAEALKTSAIEGEYLSRPDVKSSVRNHLGLNVKPEAVSDRRANGAGQLMVELYNTWAGPLTAEMLFEWHTMLLQGAKGITVGQWRSHAEPMQVISGAMGKEKVHFEAPPSSRVPGEMDKFIQWFNNTAPGGNTPMANAALRAAVAHLYFESVHPFEDGNGRIGRAVAEKAIYQTLGRPVLLSLSQVIEPEKNAYYAALQAAQAGNNDISAWVAYFVQVCYQAQLAVKTLVSHTVHKAMFLDKYKDKLNERQQKAVLRMLETPEGFEGGMTAGKYVSLTRASKATATRDLQQLADMGALAAHGGGRSTHYYLSIGA